MSKDEQDYFVAMSAELKVDVYGGESCDQHEPFWSVYAEGDKDGDDSKAPIVLNVENFPPGTRVRVEIPVCPECDQDAQLCMSDDDCDFDWKEWASDRYA